MGYYSGVRGVITMAEARFGQMMGVRVKVPPFSEPLTLEEFFEEITYHDGSCTVDSYGKHYDLEYMIELLAPFKDGETADEIVYQGESGIDDAGTYFIVPGKWAFVSVRYPTIHDVKDGDWVKATMPDAQAKTL